MGKMQKKKERNALWNTIVIHSTLCMREQWFPTPFRILLLYIYIYIYIEPELVDTEENVVDFTF
jgi:hypothetical protein